MKWVIDYLPVLPQTPIFSPADIDILRFFNTGGAFELDRY
jgi:hypothetical protein